MYLDVDKLIKGHSLHVVLSTLFFFTSYHFVPFEGIQDTCIFLAGENCGEGVDK